LLDMDVERYLLASALTGIISQKLARKLCPHCKKLRPTNDYEKNIIKKVIGKEINEIYTAVGCDECKNGYNGRIAIHEVLVIDQDIKDAISSNVKKDKLRYLVYNSGVISLLQDGVTKVLEGLTTLEELLKIIELDDDGTLNSTGLNNAIAVDELTKEEINIDDIMEKSNPVTKVPEVEEETDPIIKELFPSVEEKIETKVDTIEPIKEIEEPKEEIKTPINPKDLFGSRKNIFK